jgi:hypothetical protein
VSAALALLNLVPRWILAAFLAVALVFGGVQKLRFGALQAHHDALKVEVMAERQAATEGALRAESEARARESALMDQMRINDHAYQADKQTIAGHRAAAGTELARLRDALTRAGSGGQLPADPACAGRIDAGRAARDLLGECAAAATHLAEEADRLEAKLAALQRYAATCSGAGG